MLPPTGIEPTPTRNSVSKVAGLQMHATTRLSAFGCSFNVAWVYVVTFVDITVVYNNPQKPQIIHIVQCIVEIKEST